MKFKIGLLIFLILISGCGLETSSFITVWHKEDCQVDECGRSFTSWSEATAYCEANKYNCSYVDGSNG